MTDYLTLADVLAIHEDKIQRYGGASRVRDMGPLEAALFRTQTGYYAGTIEEVAALWESLAQNHPFIDGSKRSAFAATHTFLVINGFRISATAPSAATPQRERPQTPRARLVNFLIAFASTNGRPATP